jgi:hypothetical protein
MMVRVTVLLYWREIEHWGPRPEVSQYSRSGGSSAIRENASDRRPGSSGEEDF